MCCHGSFIWGFLALRASVGLHLLSSSNWLQYCTWIQSAQTPSQVTPGESLKPTYEDEIDAIGEQSFVSLQSEPVFHDDWLHFRSVGSFLEEIVQSQPGLVDQEDINESKNGQNIWSRQATKSLFTNLLAIRIMAFLPQNFLNIT
ncbi:hypothetical protein ILYODFUR_022976 [Ilyodon furcidens]|uniref:Uncharacterized protein n=1 Tax=Ilyodon furcidens TaxID=33524 RepID=A0ABV0U9I8_9TELE